MFLIGQAKASVFFPAASCFNHIKIFIQLFSFGEGTLLAEEERATCKLPSVAQELHAEEQ